MSPLTRTLVMMLGIISLVGCTSKDPNEKLAKIHKDSEQGYYYRAQKALRSGQMTAAVEKLDALETRYPFGRYAEQVQLELIYAHFRNQDFAQAIAAADRFLRLHPNHPQSDYALYVKALATFNLDRSVLEPVLPTDLSQRDMGAARDSFRYFNQLVSQYPNSPYYADARARMVFLRSLLAEYEVHVARFYIERGAYVAAANRGNFIVQSFQNTQSVADGLDVMVQAYSALGLSDLAADARKVLEYNYPDYGKKESFLDFSKSKPVSQQNTKKEKTWLNTLSFGLLG